ncbi:hypothetical protein BDZ89DRAFT_1152137 [Hymenopellis radicata]|nr:hypothetical protein BDZ89DRAFT_1152137 [Hymenopellis radicata]
MSIIESLEDVEEFIPAFRAVFLPHGNPDDLFDWELKRTCSRWNLSRCIQCPNPIDFNTALPPPSPLSTTKSFIFDHRKAVDPSQHPSLLRQHGQFLTFHKGPFAKSLLIPGFSYSPSAMRQDIMLAHTIAWRGEYNESHDCSWEEKWDARLEWRMLRARGAENFKTSNTTGN